MRRWLGALAACLFLSPMPAAAESLPRSLPSDPRIREFDYDPITVYELDVFMRFITAIQFAEGEMVESVQTGDSASWEITRLNRGDVLAIKPKIGNAHSNMTVFTDRRVYSFELKAREAPVRSREPNYRVRFRYREEEAAKLAAAAERANRPRDTDYHVAGEASFRPTEVYDDGYATYFTFDRHARRPAVFRVYGKGREAVVNVHHTETGFFVDAVSDLWTLRIGDEELCVAHGRVVGADGDDGMSELEWIADD